MNDGSCRHCKDRSGSHRPRGLCTTCYRDINISLLYPNKPRGGHEYEPTEEELEALISKQMADLPSWWDRASQQQDNEDAVEDSPRYRMVGTFLVW